MDARKFRYDVSVLRHARPPVRFGGKVLSRLCRGGDGESCSLRLSWRNVNQFTERQPMEFFQFPIKILNFPCLNCDKKNFEKFSSKDVLLPGGHGFSHVVACSRLSDSRDDA